MNARRPTIFLFFTLIVFHAPSLGVPVAGICTVDGNEHNQVAAESDGGSSPFRTSQAFSLSANHPANNDLFGNIHDISSRPGDLKPFKHPRVLFGTREWTHILQQYAASKNFDLPGSWSHEFRTFTLRRTPISPTIKMLSKLSDSGLTALYKSQPYQHKSQAYMAYRTSLRPLADIFTKMSRTKAPSFFLCALWTGVEELSNTTILPKMGFETCIKASVAWATILLAHRSYYCSPNCSIRNRKHESRSFVWDIKRSWDVRIDDSTAGLSLALLYDVLYDRMDDNQRLVIRSALALLVMSRTTLARNRFLLQKRPFFSPASTNYMYLTPVYLTNLAIEGEKYFDKYTSSILKRYGATGFDGALVRRYEHSCKLFITESTYADGAVKEKDSEFYGVLSRASLGLLAMHRRGNNILNTSQFRNIIYTTAQITEPWQCGRLVAHGNHGGIRYSTHASLFRYLYPSGPLPSSLWRKQYPRHESHLKWRLQNWQSVIELAILGGGAISTSTTSLDHDRQMKRSFKLSHYAVARGLLIARDRHSPSASYLHFDARPDAFLTSSLDIAARGIFSFAALGQSWIEDLPWSTHRDVSHHSLMYVDGEAQRAKSPSVNMVRVVDEGIFVVGVADLTYAYNTVWKWKAVRSNLYSRSPPCSHTDQKCTELLETLDPRSLGWPVRVDDSDQEFHPSVGLHKLSNRMFDIWKTPLRLNPIRSMVRSVGMIRHRTMERSTGVAVIADSVDAGPGKHTFESHLILSSSARISDSESNCRGRRCSILVDGTNTARLHIRVLTTSENVDFRVENISAASTILIIRSQGNSKETMWVVLVPFKGAKHNFSLLSQGESTSVILDDQVYRLGLDSKDHGVLLLNIPPMKAQSLTPYRAHRVEGLPLIENKRFFFHPTDFAKQTVFKFTAMSSADGTDLDELRTCGRFTTLRTSIVVYDCGDETVSESRYESRLCSVISTHEEDVNCSKGSEQKLWRGALQKGKPYYVAVSGDEIAGKRPRFAIRHLRRRTMLAMKAYN